MLTYQPIFPSFRKKKKKERKSTIGSLQSKTKFLQPSFHWTINVNELLISCKMFYEFDQLMNWEARALIGRLIKLRHIETYVKEGNVCIYINE